MVVGERAVPAPAGFDQPVLASRRRRSVVRFVASNRVLSAFIVIFILLVLVAVFADALTTYNPIKTAPKITLRNPSTAHWLGTDNLGRDTYSRVIKGAQVSMRVAVIAVFISLAVGVVMGLMAGYFGGIADLICGRYIDAQLAFPGILLAIAIVNALGPGLNHAMIAVGILGVPLYFRLTRGQVLQAKEQEYVRAAEVIGASRPRIMFRHILPNIANPLIVAASLAGGNAILALAALSFLGIAAQPPTPDWGAMINIGKDYLQNNMWMAIGPGVAIFLTVFTYYMLGDALRDYLDPRLKTR
ncbi:MAG TPA: ABC transporter permease [Dehalococcoidia bacterium]|nr:ABC transporter permease [Dehalococcoidia bacterium]